MKNASVVVGTMIVVACSMVNVFAAPPVTDGLKFRVDASDVSSVTTNAAGKVSQWNDLSGSGNHVAQSTDTQKPAYNPTGLNGKPSLSFNSTNVLYNGGSLICYSNHTVFLVAKATAFGGNDMLGSGGTSAGDLLVMHFNNSVFRGHYWGASGVATKDSAPNTAVAIPLVFAQRMNGTALEIYRNGTRDAVQPYSSFSANKRGIVLGNRTTWSRDGLCFAGELSEVLIYERALSDAERMQVEEYLTDKWLGDYAPVQPTPVTSGLKFRADASASQTVLTNDAGKVLQWFDLSGNGYHLQQATTAKQPAFNAAGMNGKPTLSFKGTNVLLTTADTVNYSNHTVFVVAQATGVKDGVNGENDLVGSKNLNANRFLLRSLNGSFLGTYWHTNGSSSVAVTGTTAVTFAPTLYEQRLDDSALKVFRNGLADGVADVGIHSSVLNGVSVGYRDGTVNSDYGFIGEVAEVLIYDRALSAEERQQVETHLTNKWFSALSTDLPVTRNLKFRADASDASSVTTNALGKVSKWGSRSETGYYVTQGTANKQPVYNPHGLRWRPSLSFNGTNVMALPFNAINYSNHTVFVVAQAASGNGAYDILGSNGTGAGDILLMNYMNKYRGHYWATTNPSFWLDSVSATVLTPVIYGQTLSDTGFRIYRNGQLDNEKTTGLAYTNVLRSVVVGSRRAGAASEFFTGEMSEVLIYDRALTDEERQQVEAYLYEKWLRDRRGTLIRVQ